MSYETIIAKNKPFDVSAFTYNNVVKMFEDRNQEGVMILNGQKLQKTPDKNIMILETQNGNINITDQDILVINTNGAVFPMKKNVFFANYDVVEIVSATMEEVNKDV